MAEQKQDIPAAVYRQLAEQIRKGVSSFDQMMRERVDAYDQAVLNGDDEARDKEAIQMVVFGTLAYVSLGGTFDKVRTIMDTVKLVQGDE